MSLAARCPACGTVFRVVQDQLRVSEGWVRCGRCAEVFNAIETLVDLETEAAAKPATRAPRSERVLEDLARVSQSHDLEAAPRAGIPTPPPATTVDLEVPDALEGDDESSGADAAPDTPVPVKAAPAFVVQADRAARWRRPGVRLALALAGIVGLGVLGLQVLFEYRDLVAARWPSMREPLQQACAWQGCRIEPPRAIDGLAVESSGLVRAEGTAAYRLTVVLRNRTVLALAMPAIDLTVTDTQGGIIGRRVIRPADIAGAPGSVPPATDLPLQMLLAATERPISGYTIEIFYP